MKQQLHPGVVAAVVIIVVLVVGVLLYRGLSTKKVDTSASMSPELKAKIVQTYGGRPRPTGAPTPR